MTQTGPQEPKAEAGVASAERGVVMLDGPDGVALSILPDPAEETGRRMIAAARQARAQDEADHLD